ncbi:hypothetical protein Sgleb_30760 [Streptomyces glebosus]|uniref:Uncharacterized protein n=1 Tax=Streptomyces glebosus TaxID=249580 RepID=A0A640SUA3_9ACTN|nr:hypothetical protein Sgleb_30760 [Streptomyces glebosus]GHG61310.1 hypothetical protein GCM10010513_27360 [Streptomyces glebosus]
MRAGGRVGVPERYGWANGQVLRLGAAGGRAGVPEPGRRRVTGRALSDRALIVEA